MLLCVWPALNPLSIHVTFTAIVPGTYPGEAKKCALGWLQKLTHVLLAIAILLVTYWERPFEKLQVHFGSSSFSIMFSVISTHLHYANDAKTFLKHFSDCLFYFCSTCAGSIPVSPIISTECTRSVMSRQMGRMSVECIALYRSDARQKSVMVVGFVARRFVDDMQTIQVERCTGHMRQTGLSLSVWQQVTTVTFR